MKKEYINYPSHSVSDTLYGVFIPSIILTFVLIVVCYMKGEKPHCNGGFPKNTNNN